MYEGLTLGELPIGAPIHQLKIRVPEAILMHDDKTMNEGYLVNTSGNWYISPLSPDEQDRPLYLLLMEMCNPLDDIVVI